MKFSKNELHLIRYLSFYNLFPIASMIFGGLGIPYGFYCSFFHAGSYVEAYLNNALIGASVALLSVGYLMYCFVKIVEKIKKDCKGPHGWVTSH